MTKLMTMYLTLEAVNKGELSLNDKVHITDKHYRMSTLPELSNTKLYLVKHIQLASYSKLQFLTQVTLHFNFSDEVSGNVNDFTDLMNKKAKALGMSNTHFVNPTGLENKQLKEFAPSKYKTKTILLPLRKTLQF